MVLRHRRGRVTNRVSPHRVWSGTARHGGSSPVAGSVRAERNDPDPGGSHARPRVAGTPARAPQRTGTTAEQVTAFLTTTASLIRQKARQVAGFYFAK